MEEVTEVIKNKSKILWVLLGGAVFLCISFGTLIFLSTTAQNKTLPGLMIGDISVGQMEHNELKNFLNTMSSKLSSDGIHLELTYNGQQHNFTLSPELVTDLSVVDYIRLDTNAEADRIFSLGKTNNFLVNTITYVRALVSSEQITLQNVSVDRVRLAAAIHNEIKDYEAPPQNSRLVFTSFDPVTFSLTSSTNGYLYNINESIDAIELAWRNLESPSIRLTSRPTTATVTESTWTPVLPDISKALGFGPLLLDQVDASAGFQKEWKIPVSTFASWLTLVQGDNAVHFVALDFTSTTQYLENKIGSVVGEDAENAKFEIDSEGKVVQFQAARVGLGLDVTSTYKALQLSFDARIKNATSTPVILVLAQVQPDIETSEVNNLGITEILGVGVSNFSGSPSNRVKNIRNAVRKLNGILIKPGEEFSSIKYTQPYTLEGGYFPELVIKGDEIKPEIGGGLCQIGTTLFRMAMNSAMKITERRNHSLAITYYNDPRNGQPGTDATIYDPSPDFKFLNDTSSTILIQTSMNEKTGDLKFTLWGTDDGRNGSYTKPLVSKRLPVGPTRFTETTTLAPGQKKCQHAYPGAVASFTYTRVLPDGTKEEQVFDSYYRSLPEICLIGVEKVGGGSGTSSTVPLAPVTASSTAQNI
jgi:vancomycin resistance protein YoaR